MKLKPTAIFVTTLWLLALVQGAVAQSSNDTCDLPKDLQSALANKYSRTKIVRLGDLSSEDKKFFQEDHAGTCPGVVKVDCYGDGKATFALELTTSETYPTTKLVLAHKMQSNWHIVTLDKSVGPIPVVWSEKPGEYKDIYGEKRIVATKPVIVFCGYRSFTIVYAWMNNKIAKVWLRD